MSDITKVLLVDFDEDGPYGDVVDEIEEILDVREACTYYKWKSEDEYIIEQRETQIETVEEFFQGLAKFLLSTKSSLTGDLGDEITVNFQGTTFTARWDRKEKKFKFWPEVEVEPELKSNTETEKEKEETGKVVRDYYEKPCPEDVEYTPGSFCLADSNKADGKGWVCTRTKYHAGAHHAHTSGSACHFVWED